MKSINKYFLAGCIAMLAVACNEKDETALYGDPIFLDIVTTEATATKAAEARQDTGVIVFTSEDGFTLEAACSESDMAGFAESEETKAASYGSITDFAAQSFGVYAWDATDNDDVIFNNAEVKKVSGVWAPQVTDAPVWMHAHTLNFEAVYPKPAATLGTTGLTSLTTSSTLANLAFSYKVASTAAAQEDLMFACYTGTGNKGQATLNFTHALASVSFKVGGLKGIASINSISLANVWAQGSATVSVSNGAYTYNWTPSGNATVSSSGDPKTTLTAGTELGDDYKFLLIGQTLSSKNVTVTINVTDNNGYSFNIATTLNSGTWEAGKAYTYTLGVTGGMTTSGAEVGVTVTDVVEGKVKNQLAITNTGTAKAYIRATFVGGWYDESGRLVAGWDETQGTFTNLAASGSKWVKVGDFYYYTDPVAPSSPTTDKLFATYTAPAALPAGVPAGAHLELTILAQAVVYDPAKARVTAAWGTTVASNLN